MGVAKNQITADSKPVVWIYTAAALQDKSVQFIQLGLEEEGIPCEVEVVTARKSAHELAVQAAKASSLGVGIGLVVDNKEAALHHRDLPDEQELIVVHQDIFAPTTLRRLGANSARFVKGTPLIPVIEEEVETEVVTRQPQQPTGCNSKDASSSGLNSHTDVDLELLVRIVVEVVERLNSGKANS